jgi:hypothetical protein
MGNFGLARERGPKHYPACIGIVSKKKKPDRFLPCADLLHAFSWLSAFKLVSLGMKPRARYEWP